MARQLTIDGKINVTDVIFGPGIAKSMYDKIAKVFEKPVPIFTTLGDDNLKIALDKAKEVRKEIKSISFF